MLSSTLIFLFLFGISFSDILIVPDNYSSIQEAINLSSSGDTVKVNPGIYYENLIINEKFLLIKSIGSNEETIIDGNYQAPVITCNNIIDGQMIIDGFTIKNGVGENINGSSFGGGILSKKSKLFLKNLVITNNSAFAGGGICFYSTDLFTFNSMITNVLIQNNSASEGGGIFCVNHPIIIENSTILSNGMDLYGSGGGIQALLSEVELKNVSIVDNQTKFGGGVYISNSIGSFEDVEIINNYSDSKGGGVWVGGNTELDIIKTIISKNYSLGFGAGIFVSVSYLNILNSNIVNNIASSNVLGAGIYMDGGLSYINNSIIYFNYIENSFNNPNYNLGGYSSNNFSEYDIIYSNIEGVDSSIPNGIGVISENPLFVDSDNGNYELIENSPCIDAGDPTIYDDDMTISDIGAYFYNQSFTSGDLNSDEIVNVQDIIIMVNIILGIDEYNPLSDLNEDGITNVLDIIVLVNIILEEI